MKLTMQKSFQMNFGKKHLIQIIISIIHQFIFNRVYYDIWVPHEVEIRVHRIRGLPGGGGGWRQKVFWNLSISMFMQIWAL